VLSISWSTILYDVDELLTVLTELSLLGELEELGELVLIELEEDDPEDNDEMVDALLDDMLLDEDDDEVDELELDELDDDDDDDLDELLVLAEDELSVLDDDDDTLLTVLPLDTLELGELVLIELGDEELELDELLPDDSSLMLDALLLLTVLEVLVELPDELSVELLAVLKLEELLGVDWLDGLELELDRLDELSVDELNDDAVLTDELDELLTDDVLIELELVLIELELELELLSVLEELVEMSSIDRTCSKPVLLFGPGSRAIVVVKLTLSGAPTTPPSVVSVSSAVHRVPSGNVAVSVSVDPPYVVSCSAAIGSVSPARKSLVITSRRLASPTAGPK